MTYVTRIRLRFRPGTGPLLERYYHEQFVPARQPLFASGDLLTMGMLRIREPGDRADTYELVSHWSNKAAHERNEDGPVDLAAQQAFIGYLAAPAKEVGRWQRVQHLQRLVAYGAVSALVVALYVGCIIGLQAAVVGLTGQTSPLVLVVTTLAFVVLLQTWRRRLQDVVDRQFFRRRYAAAQTLEAFGELVRTEVDPATLSDQLLAVVMETVQPEHASLWVVSPSGVLQEVGQTRQTQPAARGSRQGARAATTPGR